MREILLLILVFILSKGLAQDFLIDFRIKKIVYRGDSLVNDIPKTIEIKTSKTTDIVEVGKLGQNRFGIQLEVLKSQLGQDDRFIVGRVYYIKRGTNNDWEKLLSLDHSKVHVEDIRNKQGEDSKRQQEESKRQELIRNEPDEEVRRMYNMTNLDSSSGFGIYYYVYYYRMK